MQRNHHVVVLCSHVVHAKLACLACQLAINAWLARATDTSKPCPSFPESIGITAAPAQVTLCTTCIPGVADPSYEDLTALLASSDDPSAQEWGAPPSALALTNPAAPPLQDHASTVSLSQDAQVSLSHESSEVHLDAHSQSEPGLPQSTAADLAADASSTTMQRQASLSSTHLRSDRSSTSSSRSHESDSSGATASVLLQPSGLIEPSSVMSGEDTSMQELASLAGVNLESGSDSDGVPLLTSSSSNEDSEGNAEVLSGAQASAALDQDIVAGDTGPELGQGAGQEGPSVEFERQLAGCERQREGSKSLLAAAGTDASSAEVGPGSV